MRKLIIAAGAVATLAFAPLSVEGQFLLGPLVAFHDDADFGVGAAVEFGTPSLSPRMGFLGDFLIYFPDGFDYFEFDGNLTYEFPLQESSVLPFGLAGLNIGHTSLDTGTPLEETSSTDLSLNLGAGIRFDLGRFRPRAGVRAAFGDNTAIVIFGILPFRITG